MENNQEKNQVSVMVCQYISCLNNGSDEVLKEFESADLPENVEVIAVGCQGQCSVGPTVRITPDEIWYYRVKKDDVARIVEEHLKGGKVITEKLNPRIHLFMSSYQ